jgi:hypothetical protein
MLEEIEEKTLEEVNTEVSLLINSCYDLESRTLNFIYYHPLVF